MVENQRNLHQKFANIFEPVSEMCRMRVQLAGMRKIEILKGQTEESFDV